MKKRKVVNFHWTETTSFSSVIRPGPFAQNPYKDFQFPIFPGKDFLLLLRIPWFYFENFKKGGEDTFWMSTKAISLSIHMPHAHCHFKCAGSVAFSATIPASFPPLPLSCPKVSVVWQRGDNISLPQVLAHSAWWRPSPRGPGEARLSLSATNRVTSRPVLSRAPLFRVKKKFRAVEWW